MANFAPESTDSQFFSFIQRPQSKSILLAFDRSNGLRRWKKQFDSLMVSNVAISGGLMYVATDYGSVLGLDAITGEVKWKAQITVSDRAKRRRRLNKTHQSYISPDDASSIT